MLHRRYGNISEMSERMKRKRLTTIRIGGGVREREDLEDLCTG